MVTVAIAFCYIINVFSETSVGLVGCVDGDGVTLCWRSSLPKFTWLYLSLTLETPQPALRALY